MNERIKELDKAAQEYAGRMVGNDEDSNYNEWFNVYKETFAQLIVKECLEELRYTVLDTQELRRDKSTDYQVGWEDGMFDAGEMIKQHFGVER